MGIIAIKRLALKICHLENARLMLRMTMTFDHETPCDETLGSLK